MIVGTTARLGDSHFLGRHQHAAACNLADLRPGVKTKPRRLLSREMLRLGHSHAAQSLRDELTGNLPNLTGYWTGERHEAARGKCVGLAAWGWQPN
jgi:hypothetical protein